MLATLAAPAAEAWTVSCSSALGGSGIGCPYYEVHAETDQQSGMMRAFVEVCLGHDDASTLKVEVSGDGGVLVWVPSGLPPGSKPGSEYAGEAPHCPTPDAPPGVGVPPWLRPVSPPVQMSMSIA